MIPLSSRFFNASSPLRMSRVILPCPAWCRGHHLEFLDVNRGEDVFLYDPLAYQDRVFEVVAAPAHERHHHVSPQGEFAVIVEGRRLLSGLPYEIALHDQGFLVNAGVLVRSLEFNELVDIHPAPDVNALVRE